MKCSLSLSAALVFLSIAAPVAISSPLEKQMEVIGKATKGLKKIEGDFAKGEKLAVEALEAAKKSRDIIPTLVKDMKDEAAKAAATEDYKKQMDALIKGFEDLRDACIAKDSAKFQETFMALGEMKKKGHDAFMEEEE